MSTEHYWPFPAGPGQVVTDHDWETMASQWQANGVAGHPEGIGSPSTGNMGLYANRLTDTQIEIQPGVAHINGHWYELKIPKVLDIDITGSLGWDGTTRRDVITLRLDRANNSFRFVQLKAAAGTGGSLTLEAPADEIPLVQIDVTKSVGVTGAPGDRRWFLAGQVRPITGVFGWFDPPPRNGELGVDTAGNRLVVGKNGAWVSAREVFVNDTDSALVSQVQSLQTQVNDLNAELDTTQSALYTAEQNLARTQADLDTAEANLATARTDLNALQPGPWTNITYTSSEVTDQSTTERVQVRRQGSIIHMRGRMRSVSGADLGIVLGKGTAVISIPVGFRPGGNVYLPITVYSTTPPSSSVNPVLAATIDWEGNVRLYLPSALRSGINQVEFGCSWMVG